MVKSALCFEWSLARTGAYQRSACLQHDVSPFLINGGAAAARPGTAFGTEIAYCPGTWGRAGQQCQPLPLQASISPSVGWVRPHPHPLELSSAPGWVVARIRFLSLYACWIGEGLAGPPSLLKIALQIPLVKPQPLSPGLPGTYQKLK